MPNPILKQAVVIGAGMGGLAAAKAVAAHFEKVIVFDRDALLDPPEPRPGTPQARHTHGLLAGGCRALESLFPGIELDQGARPVAFLTDIKSVALLIASSTLTLISRLIGILLTWHRRALERAELAQMSQDELHDIGVSSADHWTETHKPFWK